MKNSRCREGSPHLSAWTPVFGPLGLSVSPRNVSASELLLSLCMKKSIIRVLLPGSGDGAWETGTHPIRSAAAHHVPSHARVHGVCCVDGCNRGGEGSLQAKVAAAWEEPHGAFIMAMAWLLLLQMPP